MISPNESGPDDDDLISSPNDITARQQQQRLQALLEAAGINTSGVDGALLSHPHVLDHLSNSVNNALSQARRAMSSVTMNDDTGADCVAGLGHMHRAVPFNYSESMGSISSLSIGESSYETLRGCLRDMSDEDHAEYLNQACSNGFYELAHVLLDMERHSPEPGDHELIRKTHTQFQNIMVSKLSLGDNERGGAKGEMTPLMEAAYNGFTDIVTLLINHGHEINRKSTTGNTALMYACCGGFEHIVHNLLCAGADTEIFNENGHTPLMEAASGGHVNCARLLVHHGAEVNCASNEFKESALTLACYKGNYDMVAFLLSAGADREHKTDEMHTSLMEASMDGHTDVARLLLDSGCNVNMPQDSFESPLTLAACGGHFDLAKLLIERGANVEEMNDEGYTALMEAAREGHDKVVQVLIEAGADVNQQTEETQETALTLACCAGFIDVAKLLIQAKADIEKGCSTPLMEAAQEGYEKLVEYLIESGAQVRSVATNGDTALDLAAENGHTKICQSLLASGANLEHLSEGGRTPIMRAARQGQEETVEFLVKAGANLNQYSENNEHTVLSFACHSGHLAVVKLLLQNGANPNATLKDGSTMLIEAARGGHTAVVTLLLDYSKHPGVIGRADYDPHGVMPLPLDPSQLAPVQHHQGELVQPGHVQTLDQLATDAREAQTRLEQLERKIKDAFNGRPDGQGGEEFTTSQGHREDLTMEIEQIQREKQHKQELMNQLQRVENEIHRKMQTTIEAKIDNAVLEYQQGVVQQQPQEPGPFKYDQAPPVVPESNYAKLDPAHDKDAISTMLGQYPTNVPGLDPSATRKEWGFTTTEFNEIMKHIQVLGPAIQKAIQRHLNPDVPSEPLSPLDEPDLPPLDKKPQEEQKSFTIKVHPNPPVSDEPVGVDGVVEGGAPPPTHVPGAVEEHDPVYFDNINDKTESNHDTPLTLACQGGHTELVQLLVERGADLEHRDKKGFTPLILSATGGFAEICEILLDAGAQIEAQSDRTKDTPLSLACSGGKKEVVELLLSREAKKEHRNVSDYTPLSLAASGGYIDIMKILLDAGAEINSRTASKLGISPLMLAAMNGHLEAVTLLLDRGADINAQIETNKNTALTLACFQGRSEVVATLLDRRANVEHRAKTGLTPLMEAASGGYVDVGRVLLEKGADVNAPPVPSSRDTALTIASDKGHKMFVELVLNWGAQVDTKNKKGNTPIWLSCNSGHLDVLQKLIEFNGDPTIPDARNCTPLMASFKKGHVKVVKYLVKKVTQFPSDTECYNYIRSIQDKDPELKVRCAQCVETIIAAKDRQEKEANKNAEQLLRQIEEERRIEDERKRKRKDRKDAVKDKRKQNKSEQKPAPKVTEKPKKEEETPQPEPIKASTPPPPPQPAAPTPATSKSPPATPKEKKKKEKKAKKAENSATATPQTTPGTPVDDTVDDPAVAALRSVMEMPKAPNKEEKKPDQATKKSKRPTKAEKAEKSATTNTNGAVGAVAAATTEEQQQQQQSNDWKFVPTKKPRKLVLSSSRIARVIGRSGCNVNAIRDVTGTHIDIEKPKKGGGERTITIRGNCESTAMAYKLMDELINSDKDITELIEQHFPDKKSGSTTSNAKLDETKKEATPTPPKTPSSIEAALAAVQQSEKIQNEKNERKRKKEEEIKKKEQEAKAREEKEARDRAKAAATAATPPKPVVQPQVHKVVPVPQPVVAEKGKQRDMDEETNRRVSEYLRGLAKLDEKKRQEKQEPPKPPPPQEQKNPEPYSPQPTPASAPLFMTPEMIPAPVAQHPPVSVTPIGPPQPQVNSKVVEPPTPPPPGPIGPGPIGPPSRRNPDVVTQGYGVPPGLTQPRPVSPQRPSTVSPIGPPILPPVEQTNPVPAPGVPPQLKHGPIGPPREPKPPVAIIPPIPITRERSIPTSYPQPPRPQNIIKPPFDNDDVRVAHPSWNSQPQYTEPRRFDPQAWPPSLDPPQRHHEPQPQQHQAPVGPPGGPGVIGPPPKQGNYRDQGGRLGQNEPDYGYGRLDNNFPSDPWAPNGNNGIFNQPPQAAAEPWTPYQNQQNWQQRWNQPPTQPGYTQYGNYSSGAGDGLHPNIRGTMMDNYPAMFADKVQPRPPYYNTGSKSPPFHQRNMDQRNTWNN